MPLPTEMLEIVFLNLSCRDLLGACAVCRFWRDVITETPSLQRLTWKLATSVGASEDPHFHTPPQKHVLRMPDGLTVLETCHRARWIRYDEVLAGRMTALEARDFRVAEGASLEDQLYSLYGEDWKSMLKDYHCRHCLSYHAHFEYEGLHPLLWFLEGLDLCVSGNGTQLNVAFCFAHLRHFGPTRAGRATQIYRHHLIDCLEHFCGYLRIAYDAILRCSLANDQFVQPLCTRLVISGYITPLVSLHAGKEGIRLGVAVKGLATVAHDILAQEHVWATGNLAQLRDDEGPEYVGVPKRRWLERIAELRGFIQQLDSLDEQLHVTSSLWALSGDRVCPIARRRL